MHFFIKLFAILIIFSLISCDKVSSALPEDSYKVSIYDYSNLGQTIKTSYSIDNSGLIFIASEQPRGRNSSSISPQNKTTVDVTIKAQTAGDLLLISMNVIINSKGGVAKSREEFSVPANTKLSTLITKSTLDGIYTDQQELIRVAHEKQFMRVAILKELPQLLP